VTDYALGWHIRTQKRHREIFHSGSQARASSFLYLQPENRMAVVVLSNLEQVDFLSLTRQIATIASHWAHKFESEPICQWPLKRSRRLLRRAEPWSHQSRHTVRVHIQAAPAE
jgi:hypothetical protein